MSSSQSLDSSPFVDKANPDPPVADLDKPHSFKRDVNSSHKASFLHSPQSLQKSVTSSRKSKVTCTPFTGKFRTGHKRPSGPVSIGNTCYANSLLQAFRCISEFFSLYEIHQTLSTKLSESLSSTLQIKINSNSEIFSHHTLF